MVQFLKPNLQTLSTGWLDCRRIALWNPLFKTPEIQSFPSNQTNQNKGLLNLFNFNGRRRDSTTTKTTPFCLFNVGRPLSISSTTNDTINFTVSYLVNSCGLSEHRALSLSKRLELKTPSKPDSVLTFFRSHGFTHTHISKVVLQCPRILLSDPNKILKPKFDFLHSIGLYGTDLADFLSNSASVLTRSLENHLIPSINFLKTLVHADTNLIKVLKRDPWVLSKDLEKHLVPKIAILQAHGTPNSNISSLLTVHPRALVQPSVDRFDEIVKQVMEMGFDPKKVSFVHAIRALMAMSKSFWEGKLDVYRRLGWSEDDIRTAFLKQPMCMTVSQNKITQIMDVLVTKMGYEPSLMACHPNVLLMSLEKRIIPRSSVLQVLIVKALIKKDKAICNLFLIRENYFLKNYVTKFESKVPELLSVYLGKVNALELLD